METMDKNPEDLEDVAKRQNSKIFYRHVSKLRGIGIKKELKRDGQNVLRMCKTGIKLQRNI